MKTKTIRSVALNGALLIALSVNLHAATYTWDGLGDNSNWGNDDNWVGNTQVSGTGHLLVFSGTNRLDATNNSLTNINSITFGTDAGAFVLGGNAFTLTGNIANLSNNLQTINNAVTFSNGTRTIDTTPSGTSLTGTINGGNSAILRKTGAGTLTISGTGNFSGQLRVGAGRILYDIASGGQIGVASIQFGDTLNNANEVSNSNAGGVYEVRGAASGATTVTSTTLALNQTSADNRVIVNANGGTGTTLNFSHLTRSTGAATGQSTVNFDLSSSSNNRINVANILGTGIAGTTNGIVVYATVTTSTSIGGTEVRRTGLAGVNGTAGNYELVRNIPTEFLSSSGNSLATNYKTQGAVNLTAAASINSLTITGAGSLGGNFLASPIAVLMEEGVGNYTFSNSVLGRDNNSLFLHQHSTDGVLTINSDLFRVAGSGGGSYNETTRLIKSGVGTVVFNGSARSLIGVTDLQEGHFQLNGSLAATSAVFIRGGGTLSGSGTIGGGDRVVGGGTPASTMVSVYEGGTLNGTYSTGDGLKINGSLTLHEGSTFALNLQDSAYKALNVTGNVTLGGDLSLTLGYAPVENQTITLIITSETSNIFDPVSNRFATINGIDIGDESTFSLTYNSQQYDFSITYGPTSVYLTTNAIPEPASISLLIGAGAVFLLRRRFSS